jgi:hypothetical protein
MATKKIRAAKPSKGPQAASRAGLATREKAVGSTVKPSLGAKEKNTTDPKAGGTSNLKPKPKNEPVSSSQSKMNGKSGFKDQATSLPDAVVEGRSKAESVLESDLTKKPAGSLQSPLRIFQVYYETWQRDLLDPNFSGLDNSKSSSETKEFSVFEQLLNNDVTKNAKLWGALSWRFAEMSGMNGSDLIKSIQAHPGYDVYFCNPYPQNEALFHNGWQQGETAHPQFLAMSKAIFEVTGLPLDELTSVSSSDLFSSTNFMVATPKFWGAYLPWVKNVLSLANKKLPPKVRDLMHSKLADERNLHNGASYVPFIVERLFPVFMKTEGKSLKAYKIPLPERERELNVHLKLLREMKDVAHRTKSAWLGVCWVNYRNLYLTQVNGKEWCKKYLRNITPTDIKFS